MQRICQRVRRRVIALLFNYSANNINTAALPGAYAAVAGSPTVGSADGPQGINTIHCNGSSNAVFLPNIAISVNGNGLIVGAGFNVTSFGAGSIGLMLIGSNVNTGGLAVCVSADGSMQVTVLYGSYTNYSSASGVFTFGNRHEVEIKISTFAGTNAVTVYLDGAAVAGLTAIDVANLLNLPDGSTIHSVLVGGSLGIVAGGSGATGTPVVVDSTYANDTTGSAPCNGPLGPCISIPMFTAGVGQESAWTPNGATPGWNCLHEVPPDGDTTYISDSNPGDEEACTLTAPFGISGVYGVSVISDQRQDTGGGGRTIELGVGNGTTRSYGSAWPLGTTYKMNTTPFSTNPLTSAPWVLADLSTLQVAAKLAS